MENKQVQLVERYREILSLLVTDYIATSEAVGSRQLSKKIFQRLSPATIRNVMSDLEEMGYLSQPHTSAGRIPTEKGFRYYVDSLVQQRPVSDEEKAAIQSQYKLAEGDVRSIMQQTGKVLAAISQYVGLVVTPNLQKTIFKHMEFLPLSKRRLLGIFVAQNGMVENRVLETRDDLNYRDLEKINNYCNARFVGLTLHEAREKAAKELTQTHGEYDRLLSRALLFSQELLGGIGNTQLVVEGETQLLAAPEFSTLEQVKQLMKSLEEKQQILQILDSCLESSGVRIFIGAESNCSAVRSLSLITATYGQVGHTMGTLGVIGPTRMDYAKVIPMVDFTAKVVSNLLENQ